MHTYEKLRDLLEHELDEIVASGELNESKLHCVDKMVDILKDLDEIEENGYSESYRARPRYSYRRNSRGYSRDGDLMMRMENMMDGAQNEDERNMIRRIMNNM